MWNAHLSRTKAAVTLDTSMNSSFASTARVSQQQLPTIWQVRSASGDAVWAWIAAAFTLYWTLFVSGAFLNHKELNSVGGVLVLAVLAWFVLERLWVRLDAVVVASIVAAVAIPLLQLSANETLSAGAVFKHVSLYMTIAASRVLNLTVACRSKVRWLLLGHVLAILLISLTIYRGTSWDGGTRHSGLFVNPNNLALIPFLLLFLVDPLRDKMFVRLSVHAVVVTVLVFSGTSGAVLAYAVGLVYDSRTMIPARWRKSVYLAVPLVLGAAIVFFTGNGLTLLPETRMTNQISVIGGQLQNVLSGGDVAYYQQERVLGPGSASGIWRVAHWVRTVKTWADGSPLEELIGFGFGSSPRMMGKLPHNEYLRMLFEQGLLGLLLFLFVWRRVIATAPAHIRYVGLIVAIYSFSENNLDNYPFMALFVICLSARASSEPRVLLIPSSRPETRQMLPQSVEACC
jgi:hypothetical protein